MIKKLPKAFSNNPDLHAYLFVSGDMNERRKASRLISQSILCRNRGDDAMPCGECDCCIKTEAGTHPDCIIIPAAEKTGVNDIRAIVSEAYLATNEADFKVFILEDADEYNVQSQNALLKIIEEPPKRVRFILTASSTGAILPTVRSRVCMLTGEIKSFSDIAAEVKRAKSGLDDTQINTLAYYVEGYEKADINSLDEEKIFDFVNKAHLFLTGKDKNVLMFLPKKREELMLCLQVFMLCTRQLALVKTTGKLCEGIMDSRMLSECNVKTSMKRAHALYSLFEECFLLAETNVNPNALISYLIKMAK